LAFFLAFPFLLRAQDHVTLRFTGQDQYGQHVQLNSVNVENITKRWQEVLYYPDTTLRIGVTGIDEYEQESKNVRLFQNVPNPFNGVTDFALQLPKASSILLEIYDLNGKLTTSYKGSLDQGNHQFRAWLETPQTYLLNARTEGDAVRIKIVNTSHAGQSRIEYMGKGASFSVENPKSDEKGDINMPFNYGDTMSYQGIAHLADRYFTSNPVVKAQYSSELIPIPFRLPLPTVTTEAAIVITAEEALLNGAVVEHSDYPVTERGFLFADNASLSRAVEYSAGAGSGHFHYTVSNLQVYTHYFYQAYAKTEMGVSYGILMDFSIIPPFYCGIDSVTDYDGNHYPTVEIGQQCWTKENLRTTQYTDGIDISVGTLTSDSIAYRYYPNNNSTNVRTYGYFYNWAATMHGESGSNANPSGVQGICPPGWHVPSKAEFEQLMNFVSSQSQYVCGNNNIARALAASFGWLCYSIDEFSCFPACYTWLNNATGFSALPAGQWSGSTADFGRVCTFWSSTSNVIHDNLCAFPFGIGGGVGINSSHLTAYAHPVRCLLNDSGVDSSIAVTPLVTTATIENITSTSASTGGFVSGSGGTPVTSRGVCWNTSPNPTLRDSHTSDGNGTGRFSSNMNGLIPSTTYYVRAYATNSVGTAYGEQQIFTTTHQ